MPSLRLGIIGALAFLPAFAQDSGASFFEKNIAPHLRAPSVVETQPAPRQFGLIRDKTDHGDGTATSTNWSGYSVLGSSFTAVTGSWVVPTASCSGVSGDQYAAFWVGLDGYNSGTVEQTGTDSDCVGKKPNYYVWYEFYPRASYEVTSVPVKPGDVIFAFVYYESSSKEFLVGVTDETTGKSFTKTGKVSGADRSSAEWITEAPCCTLSGGILPLSDFGTITLGSDSTGVNNTNWASDTSLTAPIGSFPATNVIEINKTASSTSPQTSKCSTLSSDGTSFSCTWAP